MRSIPDGRKLFNANFSALSAVELRGALKRNFPAGKYEYGRMTLERTGENLRTLDTQVHVTVLDGGDGGLGNAWS